MFCRPRSICRARIPRKGLSASPKVWKSIKPRCNRCSTISKPACRIFSLKSCDTGSTGLWRSGRRTNARPCRGVRTVARLPVRRKTRRHRRGRSFCAAKSRAWPNLNLASLACRDRDRKRRPDVNGEASADRRNAGGRTLNDGKSLVGHSHFEALRDARSPAFLRVAPPADADGRRRASANPAPWPCNRLRRRRRPSPWLERSSARTVELRFSLMKRLRVQQGSRRARATPDGYCAPSIRARRYWTGAAAR